MRNVYKKWKINSAKMNKAICAEWDGKLRVLSRLLAARSGTGEQSFAFLGIQDKNRDNPGQMNKKSPYLLIRGFFVRREEKRGEKSSAMRIGVGANRCCGKCEERSACSRKKRELGASICLVVFPREQCDGADCDEQECQADGTGDKDAQAAVRQQQCAAEVVLCQRAEHDAQ